jgi:hypothetical protein
VAGPPGRLGLWDDAGSDITPARHGYEHFQDG